MHNWRIAPAHCGATKTQNSHKDINKIIKKKKNIEQKLNDIGFHSDSLEMTPKAQARKEKINSTTIKFKISVSQRTQLTE